MILPDKQSLYRFSHELPSKQWVIALVAIAILTGGGLAFAAIGVGCPSCLNLCPSGGIAIAIPTGLTSLALLFGSSLGLSLEVESFASEKRRQKILALTNNGTVYGEEVWRAMGAIQNVNSDSNLACSGSDQRKENQISVYIPKEITLNGKTRPYNLEALKDLSNAMNIQLTLNIQDQPSEQTDNPYFYINTQNPIKKELQKLSVLQVGTAQLLLLAISRKRLYNVKNNSVLIPKDIIDKDCRTIDCKNGQVSSIYNTTKQQFVFYITLSLAPHKETSTPLN